MSNDSRAVYHCRDTAVSSVLSHGAHSSFPVAVNVLSSLFFSSLVKMKLWVASLHSHFVPNR